MTSWITMSWGMVNFTLQSTTSEMISISTSQTFRSWVVIFHHRRPMACLSLNLYDTPGACSSYECFNLRARRLSSNLLKQGYLVERLKSSFRKFLVDMEILLSNMGVTVSRMLNDILTLDHNDFPTDQIFHQFHVFLYRAWPSPNYEWFPWSICNGCG